MGTLEASRDTETGQDRRPPGRRPFRDPRRSRELGRPWRIRLFGTPWRCRALGRPWRIRGSVLTQCISVWYSNATNQDCKALQRVVRLAERISGSALPSLQDIYLKRCKSRAAKIIKDSNHPGNHLFISLPSGKRFRSVLAKTERLRRSFYPQAIRLLNSVSYHL